MAQFDETTVAARHKLLKFATQSDAADYLAHKMGQTLKAAIADHGRALYLAAGGSTPKPVYQAVAQTDMDWSKVTQVILDERFVPLDDARSNQKMLASCFAGSPAEAQNVFGLTRDDRDLEASVNQSEAALKALGGGDCPAFDFALMGMGPDGHYASIFPLHPINISVYNSPYWVMAARASDVPDQEPQIDRITLTVPAINRAKEVYFYITGETKLKVLQEFSQIADPFQSPIGAYLVQSPVTVHFVWAP